MPPLSPSAPTASQAVEPPVTAAPPPRATAEASGSISERLDQARQVLGDKVPGTEVDQLRAVEFLLAHVDRLEVMLKHTKDMITVLGEDGAVLFSNAAAGMLTGYSESVNSTNATEFIHPDDLERVSRAFDGCVAEPGSHLTEEFRIRHADGSWHYVDAYAENCLNEAVGGVVVSMRDICGRKATETTMERANQALREFVAVASHDLRSPVAVVNGMAASLISDWEDLDEPDRLERAEVVARASGRMARLVDNLLVVSRLDSGSWRGKPQGLDLYPLVTSLLSHMEGIEGVEVDISADLSVWCDRDHLERMVTNYLHNALNHGRAPVVVSATRAGDEVVLSVTDAGPGVPPEFHGQLFQRFSRSEKTQARGTGLGLSIVRDLARASGGDAWYQAGDGGRFLVRLPAGSSQS